MDQDQADRIEAKLDAVLGIANMLEAAFNQMASNPILKGMMGRFTKGNHEEVPIPHGDSLPGGSQ